ncbi:MAG: imidazole glycerol phosphate synthase subunit HisH, partial [Deltaproteobacteria bacterium]
ENAFLIEDAKKISSFDKLILPGVGSFKNAMEFLQAKDMIEPIKNFIKSGKYALGICLGMQILFNASEEGQGVSGLGLIDGEIKRFSHEFKTPHMGWSKTKTQEDAFFGQIKNPYLYFVHSYFCPITPYTIAKSSHGVEFSAVIKRDNLYGIQPHPEKSHEQGLQMLKNFAQLGTL